VLERSAFLEQAFQSPLILSDACGQFLQERQLLASNYPQTYAYDVASNLTTSGAPSGF